MKGQGITIQAVLQNKTFNITEGDKDWKKYYYGLQKEMKSEIAVPLLVRGKPIGDLEVDPLIGRATR